MFHSWRRFNITITCALAAVIHVEGQKQTDPEVTEIAAYRLTSGNLQKVINVNRAVLQALMKDARILEGLKIEAELTALSKKEQPTDADEKRMTELEARKEQLEDTIDNPLGGTSENLTQMEARIKQYAPMAEALQREHMAPREYAKFWLTFLQAAFVHGFQKSGVLKQLPPDVHPENVKFIADHEAEITAMQKEFEQLGRRH